jgi:hypothetical protein
MEGEEASRVIAVMSEQAIRVEIITILALSNVHILIGKLRLLLGVSAIGRNGKRSTCSVGAGVARWHLSIEIKMMSVFENGCDSLILLQEAPINRTA